MAQRVVPTDRYHQVGRVAGDFRSLSGHRARRCPIYGEQRRPGPFGEQRAQVRHDVRLRSRVGTVVKDRIAQQHDVNHVSVLMMVDMVA